MDCPVQRCPVPGFFRAKLARCEEICNISFMKKKTVTYSPLPSIPVPTEEEFMDFYQKLYECDVQEESSKGTAILSVIEGHSHRYKPKTLQLNLPTPLSKLYSKAKLHNDLSSLLVESESIFDNLQITEQQPNVLAYTVHCQTDTHGRPVAGVGVICRDSLTGATYSHQAIVQTIIHELFHTLGFSKELFHTWRDCSSKSQVAAGCSPRGKVSHSDRSGQMRIYTPSLISTLQKHLASTDPELGGPLENLDVAPGRVSSHWESRVLQGSIMAPVLGDSTTVRIDPVTLAALQDTGWYTVDLNQAQSLVWGDGEGATFGSLSTCRNKSSSFFCTGSGFGCHYLHLHKGECQTDQHLEGCRVYKPLKNGSECWIEKNGRDEDLGGGGGGEADGAQQLAALWRDVVTDTGTGSWSPLRLPAELPVASVLGVTAAVCLLAAALLSLRKRCSCKVRIHTAPEDHTDL
ncbi:leishmanolysin-like peptidase 2 [Perca fluviatilis]|uniref:leishmanolysin-like peptidase 2 n=1 Tax=Perca fluviatilis TaxID=8168 RepID=UPI001962DC94|nr:leishmanolysin-like peptidase 2 [Perca fluviatilis]